MIHCSKQEAIKPITAGTGTVCRMSLSPQPHFADSSEVENPGRIPFFSPNRPPNAAQAPGLPHRPTSG